MENVISLAKNLILDKFPDAYAALLTGSFVDGYNNKESDLDIYVITNSRDFFFTESFLFHSKKFHVIHLSLNKIDEILWLDAFNRTGIHLGSFSKGNILIDKRGYLTSLIEECKKVFFNGPNESTKHELFLLKINVLNLLSDFKGNKRDEEKMILAHDLYKAFLRLYLSFHRCWNSSNKHLARQFNSFNPKLSKQLLIAMQEFHKTLDPILLLNIISKELAIIGDINNGYSNANGFIEIKDDYLIISITSNEPIFETYKWLTKNILPLKIDNVISHFIFRTRPLGDHSDVNEVIYLVIQYKNIKYNKARILSDVKELFDLIKVKGIKVYYPINFDFSILLAGRKLISPIFKVFHVSSKQFSLGVTNSNNSVSFSLLIIKNFETVFFNNDHNNWLQFLKFTDFAWLSRAYDNGKYFNIRQLLQAKENLILEFNKQYTNQEKSLSSFLKNIKTSAGYDEINNSLELVKTKLIKGYNFKAYQLHPVDENYVNDIRSTWVIYKNMLDYLFGIFLLNDIQKSYIIYVSIKLT